MMSDLCSVCGHPAADHVVGRVLRFCGAINCDCPNFQLAVPGEDIALTMTRRRETPAGPVYVQEHTTRGQVADERLLSYLQGLEDRLQREDSVELLQAAQSRLIAFGEDVRNLRACAFSMQAQRDYCLDRLWELIPDDKAFEAMYACLQGEGRGAIPEYLRQTEWALAQIEDGCQAKQT